jgi:hypothetical protein
MTVATETPAPGVRRWLFPIIAILMGTSAGLLIVEYALRYHAAYVASRESMDPGFLVFDPELGWEMARDWSGAHRHYDFDVRYTTNVMGLRGDWPEPPDRGVARYAFLGDSFTFGLGVNDEETFVALVDDNDPATDYLNAGIAGYSTDQQYLYLRRYLPGWRLDGLRLVVYLGNDVLDNTLAFPLQADMGKPLFDLESDGLRLTNVPVPLQRKPVALRGRTLATMVLGEQAARDLADSWRSRWQLARRLGLDGAVGSDPTARFAAELAYPIDLTMGLIVEIQRVAAVHGASLDVVLLPGRSFVEEPDGLSAAFQDYLRLELIARAAELGIPTLDLAQRLRDVYSRDRERLFHANEGHLTSAGHRVVAGALGAIPVDASPR